MARDTGPAHRLCRRVGEPLCGQADCPAIKRPYPPGQHGKEARRRTSEYGRHLIEKQKARYIYGVLERQFRRYFARARRARGRTGEQLLQLLETRLDNIVYRLGFARTLQQARQLVSHGHVQVNGRRVDIPSYPVKPGDTVGIREKSRDLDVVRAALEERPSVPAYLERDDNRCEGRLVRLPAREEIPVKVDESLIVEFYSR